MGKTIKISPIKKEYSGKFKTMESSLSDYGFSRFPGTKAMLTPKMEADGRYRTGLDKTALYIKGLGEPEKAAELALIDELTEKLENMYGKWNPTEKSGINLSPRSAVWNVWSELPVKASAIPLSNGDILLDTSDPQDLLNYCWVRKHNGIAKSLESWLRGDCPDCQYYIADDDAENKMQYKKNKSINVAISKFDALSPTKASRVARLMGLPAADDTKPEVIYNMMSDLLKTPVFKDGEYENTSTISVFERILQLTDDELYTRDLVEESIRHNLYRMKGDKVMEGNETLAANKAELVKFLMDTDNQKDLLALEARVKAKKISAL